MTKSIFGILSCFTLSFWLVGCGDTQNPELDLQLPNTIQWSENQTLNYQVKATGEAPLSYGLLSSDDVEQFSIDPLTGLLTSNDAFDFELPADANGDGIYELKVAVVDANNHSASKNVQIKIEDLRNNDFKVTFPITGSNAGGFESTIHFHGVLFEGDVRAFPSANFEIKVNGQAATFIKDHTQIIQSGGNEGLLTMSLPGEWIAEVPLEVGSNHYDVELFDGQQLVRYTAVDLDNTPIPNSETVLWDGGDYSYATTLGQKGIMQTNIQSGETQLVTSVDNLKAVSECAEIRMSTLSPDGQDLIISCSKTDGTIDLIIQHLHSSSSQLLITDDQHRGTPQWVDSHNVLLNNGRGELALVKVDTNEIKRCTLVHPNSEVSFGSPFALDNHTVYIKTFFDDNSDLSTFDFNTLLNSSTDNITIPATSVALNYPYSSDLFMADGYGYAINRDEAEIIRFNLNNNAQEVFLKGYDSTYAGLFPDPRFSISVITSIAEDHIILRNFENRKLFSISLNNGEILNTFSPKTNRITSNKDIDLKSDGSKMAVYDFYNHTFGIIDLQSYTLTQFHNFQGSIDQKELIFGGNFSYDWTRNIIYRTNDLSNIQNQSATDIGVFSMDVTNSEEKSLLSIGDIQSLNYYGANYRISDIAYLPQNEQLLISLYTTENMIIPGDAGIITYDLASKTASNWYNNPASTYYDEGITRFTSYTSELSGLYLYSGQEGAFYFIADKTQGISIDDPIYFQDYPTPPYNSIADIDPENNSIYMIGPRSNSELGMGIIPNRMTQNGITRKVSEIGEHSLSLGLHPQFQYNKKLEVLMDYQDGYIFIIDPWTGDRVLKEVTNSSSL